MIGGLPLFTDGSPLTRRMPSWRRVSGRSPRPGDRLPRAKSTWEHRGRGALLAAAMPSECNGCAYYMSTYSIPLYTPGQRAATVPRLPCQN